MKANVAALPDSNCMHFAPQSRPLLRRPRSAVSIRACHWEPSAALNQTPYSIESSAPAKASALQTNAHR